MTENLAGQMSLFAQDTWCGKTSLEPCPQTKEKTSVASSKKPLKSSKKMPLYLDLRVENGATQDASWEQGGALLGEYTMRSFGEKPSMLTEECCFPALPNGVSESRLSQILVDIAHPKYSLSAKACQGILNRANKRGKKLPEILQNALESQCAV